MDIIFVYVCVKKSEAKFESLRLLYLFEKGRKFSIDRVDAIEKCREKIRVLIRWCICEKGRKFLEIFDRCNIFV